MSNIKKLLIANRGEIALRIMRSAKEMDISTVAVYSEADREAPHVRYADEAICIGPPAPAASYLDMDKIIDAARQTNSDAIHPGYGFLSENAAFAEKVQKAGIVFVGPTAAAMETMGDKLKAKAAAKGANIPLVPGTAEAISDVVAAKQIAKEVGYPILIKASAGGGGKGMRIVEHEQNFEAEMDRAVSEAKLSFGNGAVFIEKFIERPRHIEIQVLGDQHGQVVHLFERECSIQRRYQKVIEEAPSAVLTEELRTAMGETAVQVAKACGYYGAGTVEFIVDKDLNYYFLEMNTRLQVEHPVTEFITGIDLVKEQIKIAEGQKLSFDQSDLHISGHAIEIRVTAEDAFNNFLPETGLLTTYVRPQGPGVRVDDGFEQGMEVSVFYDSLLGKLIVYAENREHAIKRMLRAIDEFQISGLSTTLPFCKFVLQHEAFTSGQFDTKFIEQHFQPAMLKAKNELDAEIIGAVMAAFLQKEHAQILIPANSESKNTSSAWKLRRF